MSTSAGIYREPVRVASPMHDGWTSLLQWCRSRLQESLVGGVDYLRRALRVRFKKEPGWRANPADRDGASSRRVWVEKTQVGQAFRTNKTRMRTNHTRQKIGDNINGVLCLVALRMDWATRRARSELFAAISARNLEILKSISAGSRPGNGAGHLSSFLRLLAARGTRHPGRKGPPQLILS